MNNYISTPNCPKCFASVAIASIWLSFDINIIKLLVNSRRHNQPYLKDARDKNQSSET